MDEPRKKISLTQATTPAQSKRIMREKIGDLGTLGSPPETETAIEGADTPDQQLLAQKIIDTLKTIYDPEIPLNIYELGLIYRIVLSADNAVRIDMTLTAPGCPVAGDIVTSVKRKIELIPEVPSAQIELVWEPAWTRDRLTEAARLELGLM